MANETVIAEHDRADIDRLVAEMPPAPTDERIWLTLEIAYSLGRRTGYTEAVEVAKKHMTSVEGNSNG